MIPAVWLTLGYIAGGYITYIVLYALSIREYKKEGSGLEFDYWLDSNDFYNSMVMISIMWVLALLVGVAILPIRLVVKLLKKKML